MNATASPAISSTVLGGRAPGSAHPAIVEHNNVVLRRHAIHDPRIPIVQYRRQMVEEHHGDAALLANLSEHEVRAIHIDRFGRRIFKGHAHVFLSIIHKVA